MLKRSVVTRTAAALAALFLGMAQADAALINSYDFNGDLTDSLGNGPDLVALSATDLTTSPGRNSFGNNQGLRLDSALADTSSYAIEIKFRMTTNPGEWKKFIDYQNLAADTGVYIRNNALNFYGAGLDGATAIPVGTDIVATIARDGGTGLVSGFIDGALQWTFADAGNFAVPGANILTFFNDDNTTGQSEAFAGSVDYIRIFDGPFTAIQPIPEPGILLVLGVGLATLGVARRRTA